MNGDLLRVGVRALWLVSCLLVLAAAPARARAQDSGIDLWVDRSELGEARSEAPCGEVREGEPAVPGGEGGASRCVHPRRRYADRAYWSHGLARWFLAGAVDVGVLYFRPRVSAGWGTPHATWVGVDANPIISAAGAGAYAGLRAALPLVDLRLGGRYYYAFSRSFLEPRDHYDVLQMESRDGPTSSYLSLEAELTVILPIGPGAIIAELAGTSVQLVDSGYYVFEETIRVVVDPPWVWRTRFGYGVSLGPGGIGRIALIADVVGIPKRGDVLLRGGLEGSLLLWDDLELRVRITPAIVNEDALGAAGGDSFLIGLRYRFATGPAPRERR